ncbi:MAG: c-type cytochrome [Planctomycetaceae bacterium]|nr:c-type cytochrome [Planctomycetaceae bacterium]
MMNRTNTVLAVLLVVVVVMTAGVGVDYSKPNIEILPDMKYTPAWEAFAANPNFADGRTMQPPVPGTIARGQLPLYYTATKEDAVRAGEELVNPVSRSAIEAAVDADVAEPTARAVGSLDIKAEASELLASPATTKETIVSERFAASLERGSKVYLTYCISCHGPKGAGDGLVPQRGFPPPPSMLTGKSLQMKDGQLFHILTYGQGSMAPFASQLSRDLRWDVINYVRDLQSKAPPVPETAPVETEAPSTPLTDEPASQVKAEVTATPKMPVPEPEPNAPSQPTEETKATDDKATATTETEESKTPPNELRDASADDAAKTEAPQPEVPAVTPEPTTESEG